MVMSFHGNKEDTSDIYLQQSDYGFSRHTFLYNRRCLTSGKNKLQDEDKVAATDQGNFYWERRLCLF